MRESQINLHLLRFVQPKQLKVIGCMCFQTSKWGKCEAKILIFCPSYKFHVEVHPPTLLSEPMMNHFIIPDINNHSIHTINHVLWTF